MPTEPDFADPPDQHGFAMTGYQTIFLCHLAMFAMQPHQYQLVVSASLPAESARRYVASRKAKPEQPYILGNLKSDLFTIPQLVSGRRTTFQADIFRGAPKDPNVDKPFIHDVQVRIDRIVVFRRFDQTFDYPKNLTYFLFGAGDEAHLCHYLTKRPDFDHVLDLARVPDWLDADHLLSGITVNFTSFPKMFHKTDPFPASKYQVTAGENAEYWIQLGTRFWFDAHDINHGSQAEPERAVPREPATAYAARGGSR